MDNVLKARKMDCSHWVLDVSDECGVSGDFSLPEYCPDIAVVLKCVLTGYVQNRQWSGEQLLVDGTACARVLYLDEERKCVRTAEFTLPFSCMLHAQQAPVSGQVSVDITTKYCNCRAVGPRNLEIRGAVNVVAKAVSNHERDIVIPDSVEGLHTKCANTTVSSLISYTEKIITVNESLDFPETLQAAAMLLGGECRPVIRESKLLTGKAIIKGNLYVHQLYTDALTDGSNYCLDFEIPFSQIMDVDGAEENDHCTAQVQLLSDIERCAVGPDGQNSVLELTAKLLIQVAVHRCNTIPVLCDAYHSTYPTKVVREESEYCAPQGMRWEQTVLPLPIKLPQTDTCEVVDVWVTPQEAPTQCRNGLATLSGRMIVCVLLRDSDGCILYHEQAEDYCLEFSCDGNRAETGLTVTELRYRLVDKTLELQIGLCVKLACYLCQRVQSVCELELDTDSPYPTGRATAMVYYAQPGENLWDIGRYCHASVECICQENDLSQQTITNPMVLLVPIA